MLFSGVVGGSVARGLLVTVTAILKDNCKVFLFYCL